MANNILLVGCGRMGGALLAGWLDRGLPGADIHVVEPQVDSPCVTEFRERGVRIVPSCDALPPAITPDVIVLAVKPQAIDDIAPPYRRFLDTGPVVLSVVAGRTINAIAVLLRPGAAIVRCMPNTPAAIRLGVTVACANAHAREDQRALCARLLEAIGEVLWIDDEGLMDAVTAVSGSGPAYVFLLAEELAAAGVAAGLPAELAERLARLTIAGAGALLAGSGLPPVELRRNVTSPGGTTEAALAILQGPRGLSDLMNAAVRAATDRSRALAQGQSATKARE